MILYRNTKVKVRSPDGDTEYFDIVAGVLRGDTLAPYLFMVWGLEHRSIKSDTLAPYLFMVWGLEHRLIKSEKMASS